MDMGDTKESDERNKIGKNDEKELLMIHKSLNWEIEFKEKWWQYWERVWWKKSDGHEG